MSLSQKEGDELDEMLLLNSAFLKSDKGSKQVREFLQNAHNDMELLMRFLKGRKYQAKYAWETLKCYAEVRFDMYSDLFPLEFSDSIRSVAGHSDILGMLKKRDKLGRVVGLFNFGAWDTEKYTPDDMDTTLIKMADVLYINEDVVENGVVIIFQCKGFGMRHAALCTIKQVQRSINIFARSYPVKVKGVYFVNMPIIFSGVANIIRYFFPSKLKKRLIITSQDFHNCKDLQDIISPDSLPRSFGGNLEFYEAVEDVKHLFC